MSADALNLLVRVNRSRATAAGLDVFLYDHLTHGVVDFDDWRNRFDEAAGRFAVRGAEAIKNGQSATAGDAFSIAALCAHYATCVPGGDREAITDLLQRAADAHRAALSASARPFVRFAQADTGGMFCGILEMPVCDGAAPLVIVVPGLDSSKEEFDRIATRIRERGLATLRIDGPGQGEMLSSSGPVSDYERVVTAAIDCVSNQPGLDLKRIGAVGLSFGGYYVPRAIAHEPRVRAAVAITGPFRLPAWSGMPDMLRAILALRCGTDRQAEEFVGSIDLAAIVARIEQPLLVIAGASDPIVSAEDAYRLARDVRQAELIDLRGGDHLGANRRWEWEARMADWLADRLDDLQTNLKGDS